MDDLPRILKAASDLGHLLQKNELVVRFAELNERLRAAEASRNLLEEYVGAAQEAQMAAAAGEAVTAEEEARIEELAGKVREDSLLREYLATQRYYADLMGRVDQEIAQPSGEPPKESNLILPGQGGGGPGIIIP